jgi:hypothetical protein
MACVPMQHLLKKRMQYLGSTVESVSTILLYSCLIVTLSFYRRPIHHGQCRVPR